MSKIPKLRFKEFSGEWDGIKLKTISNKIGSGSTPRGGEKVYKKFGIPFIRSQNVNNNQLIFDNTTYIDEEIHSNMNNSCVIANDILLNITGASIGRSCVVPKDFKEGNVNQHVCIIRLKDDYEPTFLQPFLASHNGKKLVFQGQTGSGREGINFQSIGAFKLNIPSKQEQEKIASFLNQVDTKIEQLTKKETLLKEYKKGVMQKIFNQEIRFKADDGSEFCGWQDKKLSSLCSIKKGSQLNKDTLTEVGDYPAINGGINPSGYTTNYNTEAHTITISEGGNSCGYVNFITTNFWSGGHNYSLQELKKNIENLYLFQYLKHNEHLIMRLRVGSGLPNIQKGDINNFKVLVPCLEEQNKIANFLSSIDTKVEQTQKQLELGKEFKKALLQQMFV
jgi:type I restriction enzyme S subunit